MPRAAGGMPSNLKLPNFLLSTDIGRSPCKTTISTVGWLSLYVENTCDFLVGIVVFLFIIGVATPPAVSIESVSGVTSNNNTSST